MEKSKPVVVGIGELLWDVFPEVKKAGGAPINFVYHATQLGAEGYAISAVGNDVFGTEIIQELDKNGIDSNYISTVEYPTGSVMVELKNGIPSYTIIEGVAWDHIPFTQASIDLMKRADAVCFGTLAPFVMAHWLCVRRRREKRSCLYCRMHVKMRCAFSISISVSISIRRN